jgi:DNA helicase-2/ATP-dependent DNA helicase PcrA
MGAIDFGDIILYVLKLFENNVEILHKYQNQFKYILVDEFQDTNAAQMNLLKMLTHDKENPNICCVGDDDQSIYSWRGAEIKNILEFEKTYPGAKIIRLEINYRSSANILGAANSLIKNNMGRLGKDLRSVDNTKNGEPVYVFGVPSDWAEARFITDIIMKNANNNFSDFAVLIRAGSLSRTFEEEFTSRGVPYKLVGATKFYDRAEIRDAIAYIRLLVYPFDDISFERIISKPRRGFGDGAITKLRESGAPLMDALRVAKLSAKHRVSADEFLSAFDFDWQNMKTKDAVQQLLDNSG